MVLFMHSWKRITRCWARCCRRPQKCRGLSFCIADSLISKFVIASCAEVDKKTIFHLSKGSPSPQRQVQWWHTRKQGFLPRRTRSRMHSTIHVPIWTFFAYYSDLCSFFADALQKESAREKEKALGLRSNAPSTPSGYLLTGEPGLGNIESVCVCAFANLFFHRSNDQFKQFARVFVVGDFINPPSRPVGPFFRSPSSEVR
jgi:hypothetical protein